MSEDPKRRLVPRRRHKNVIEAPIPSTIVGEVLEAIERKLRNVWQITLTLECLAAIYIIHHLTTSTNLSTGTRFFGTLLTAVYCVVLVFNRMQHVNPSKLSSVFSTLWLAAACTPVAYSGEPEVPVVIGCILCVGYSLLGDRSLMRQLNAVLVLLSILWLGTFWGSPLRGIDNPLAIKTILLLATAVVTTIFVTAQIVKVQALRIFGNSIKGLEGMQRALADLHNRRVADVE